MTPPIRMVSVPEDALGRMTQAIVRADAEFGHELSAYRYRTISQAAFDALVPSLTAAPVREEGGAGPGGYLVKDFADGWYWTPNAALDHAGGAPIWSIADSRYESEPPALATREEAPAEAGSIKNLHRLASQEADHLEREAEEADDNNWQDWAVTMRQAADYIRQLIHAQPQAREEAQPAPFMFAYEDVDKPGEWRAFRQQIKRADGSLCPGRALYTTPPAPEAEKLRENGE